MEGPPGDSVTFPAVHCVPGRVPMGHGHVEVMAALLAVGRTWARLRCPRLAWMDAPRPLRMGGAALVQEMRVSARADTEGQVHAAECERPHGATRICDKPWWQPWGGECVEHSGAWGSGALLRARLHAAQGHVPLGPQPPPAKPLPPTPPRVCSCSPNSLWPLNSSSPEGTRSVGTERTEAEGTSSSGRGFPQRGPGRWPSPSGSSPHVPQTWGFSRTGSRA